MSEARVVSIESGDFVAFGIVLGIAFGFTVAALGNIADAIRDMNTVRVDTVYVQQEDTLVLTESAYRDLLVLREADRQGVDGRLALAVARTENTRGIPTAVSNAGAVGLMQVMPPVWGGVYPDCGDDLFDAQTNVCYGVRILRYYLALCGEDEHCALAKYNGATKPHLAARYINAVNAEREAI